MMDLFCREKSNNKQLLNMIDSNSLTKRFLDFSHDSTVEQC